MSEVVPDAGASNAWIEAAEVLGGSATIVGALDRAAAEEPDRPFLQSADDHVTFGECADRARSIAGQLAERGVMAGDVVVLYMHNSVDMVTCTFALGYLGAAASPINIEYVGDLLTYVVGDTGADLAIVDASLVEQFLAAADGVEAFAHGTVIVRSDVTDEVELGRPFVDFDELRVGAHPLPPVSIDQSTTALIIYTGGTTGPSKGVIVTNGHALTFASDWTRCVAYTGEDVLYGCLPLFHGLAYLLGVLPTLLCRAKMVIDRRFSASNFWERAIAADATVVHSIFSMVPILLSRPPSDVDRAHRVRAMYIGPSKYADEFRDRFGVELIEVYGQSETGVVTYAPFGQLPAGSCGRVNPHFEVRIVDEMDIEVPPGQPGEIIVRPKVPYTMMRGYLSKDTATVETFKNLWHHSGDRGIVDEDGWFYFVDRMKDCIRRRGENISSYEVELVITQHPQIVECAVFAVPSDLEEDEVKACVVVDDADRFDPIEFQQFLVDRMARFMRPRYLEVVESLPKSAAQKIEKYKLIEAGVGGPTGTTLDLDRLDVGAEA